jgi:long-subunit acyl-CoA synthetase (AMP-forming)
MRPSNFGSGAHHPRREVRCKGPNVMPGYWRAAKATAECFDKVAKQ